MEGASLEKYVEYYFKFKELTVLHRGLGFGDNPPLPEVFTQDICRHLYKLGKWEDRKADAKDSNGKAIEIKATGTPSGTTTIDMNAINNLGDRFAGLYWMYFDLDNDEIEICYIEAKRFAGIQPKPRGQRNNITLSQYVGEETPKVRFCFERRVIRKASVG